MGTDTLVGGAGPDTFIWTSTVESGVTVAAADSIGDFEAASDRIDLQAIDADQMLGGNQAFAFIGTGAFTADGRISLPIEGSDNVIR